jgi:hypothetical protein
MVAVNARKKASGPLVGGLMLGRWVGAILVPLVASWLHQDQMPGH